MTLEEAMSEKMVFYQDYYTVLGPDTAPKACHLRSHFELGIATQYHMPGKGVSSKCHPVLYEIQFREEQELSGVDHQNASH